MKISQKQKQELIISWCFSLVPLIALFETYTKFVDLGMNTGGGEQNAALFPRMISFLLLFLIGINTVRIFIQASNSPSDEKAVPIFEPEGRKRLALMFVCFVAYVIALSILGYYVSTPLALLVFFFILGVRKPIPLILLSIGTTVFIWYAFAILLKVVLPVGKFGLYF
jgi:putative tricarboxylic transport membrane protein